MRGVGRRGCLAAAVLIGAAACGGEGKMAPENAARAFATATSPVRTNVVCRDAGDRGPRRDYECWYTYRVGGEPVRTNTFISVDEDSITNYDPS